jgi:hypothetical protein
MPKVDVLLALVQAATTYGNDQRINAMYALLAVNRNQLQWIVQNQPDNGDVMATDAVLYSVGKQNKPAWMAQAGL